VCVCVCVCVHCVRTITFERNHLWPMYSGSSWQLSGLISKGQNSRSQGKMLLSGRCDLEWGHHPGVIIDLVVILYKLKSETDAFHKVVQSLIYSDNSSALSQILSGFCVIWPAFGIVHSVPAPCTPRWNRHSVVTGVQQVRACKWSRLILYDRCTITAAANVHSALFARSQYSRRGGKTYDSQNMFRITFKI